METQLPNTVRKARIVFLLLLALAGLLLFAGPEANRLLKSKASAADPSITLNPTGKILTVNEETSALLSLNTKDKRVSGLSIVIKYDPQVIGFTRFEPDAGLSKGFTEAIENTINSQKGELRLTMFSTKKDSELPVNTVVLGTLKIKGIGVGKSLIKINEQYEVIGFAQRSDSNYTLSLENTLLGEWQVDQDSAQISPTTVNPSITSAQITGDNFPFPTGSGVQPTKNAQPSSSPAPSLTSAIPYPTSSGVGSVSQLAGNISLNIKIKLQGILNQNNNIEKIPVIMRLLNEANNQTTDYQTVVFDTEKIIGSNSIKTWTGKVTFKALAGTNYSIYIKGPKHLRKKICDSKATEVNFGGYNCLKGNINLIVGENNLDLSNIYLIAGDLPTQDGLTNAYDLALIINNLGKTERSILDKADVNYDDKIDTQDFALVLKALGLKNEDE